MINKVIFQLVTFMRSTDKRTSFFSTLKHNNDLCPEYSKQLDNILQAFQKYQALTYDIQGPKDRGSDIVLKLPYENGEVVHIAFQIKSEDDLRNADYLKILKAQYFDAERTYKNLLDYYILLCCDSKKNIDKIRTISSDFSQDGKVHVINPEYALTFYKLSKCQMDALIKAKLGSEDVVYRNALWLVSDLTPTEKAIIFYMTYVYIFAEKSVINIDDLFTSNFIREVYNLVPDYGNDWFFIEDEQEDIENADQEDDEDSEVYEDYDDEFELRGLTIEERISYDLENLEGQLISQESSGEFKIYLMFIQLFYLLLTGMLDMSMKV